MNECGIILISISNGNTGNITLNVVSPPDGQINASNNDTIDIDRNDSSFTTIQKDS